MVLSKTFKSITPAKTLLPKQVAFTGTRSQDLDLSSRETQLSPQCLAYGVFRLTEGMSVTCFMASGTQ